jgi:hypothetical protein
MKQSLKGNGSPELEWIVPLRFYSFAMTGESKITINLKKLPLEA